MPKAAFVLIIFVLAIIWVFLLKDNKSSDSTGKPEKVVSPLENTTQVIKE